MPGTKVFSSSSISVATQALTVDQVSKRKAKSASLRGPAHAGAMTYGAVLRGPLAAHARAYLRQTVSRGSGFPRAPGMPALECGAQRPSGRCTRLLDSARGA